MPTPNYLPLSPEIESILSVLADDAFEVQNWARRHGMKREQQVAQTVEAFRKTLADTEAEIVVKTKVPA